MFDTHVTREGHKIPISEMTDNHLVNFINYVLRGINAARDIDTNANTELEAHLYRNKAKSFMDSYQKANFIREQVNRLYPYFAEAVLRGLSEKFESNFQQAMRRKAAIETPKDILFVSAGDSHSFTFKLVNEEDHPDQKFDNSMRPPEVKVITEDDIPF